MATEWERLVAELTTLRQKRGLTLQALASCPTVLAVLNDPPLEEARDRFVVLVNDLGTDERALALRHAYAIGLDDPKLLTARRADLEAETGRDRKTLAGYEDAMIRELASRLLGSRKPGVSDSQVVVVGTLDGQRLSDVTVTISFPEKSNGDAYERSVQYENRSQAARSMPALLYQLPHDWQPRRLVLAVKPNQRPGEEAEFWASPGRELLDLMFASLGQQLPVIHGYASMQIDDPKPGVIYAIFWMAPDQPRSVEPLPNHYANMVD